MNSPEAQYQLAKKMPTASLANILRGIPGAIDQGIAMMVLGERQRMKTASQGQQAGAEAQQPSVKDRMLLAQQGQLPEHQGIGTLPSPNMGQVADVAMGAQGGVVGFAGGGDVAKFAGPMGSVVGEPYNPHLDTEFRYDPRFESLTNEEKMRYLQQREIAARQAAGKIGGASPPAPTSAMPSANAPPTYPVNNPRVAPPPPAMLDPMNPGVTNSPLAKVGNAPAAASSSYTQVSGTPMGEVPPPQRGRISAKMGAGNVARGRGYGLAGVGASIFDAAYLANPGFFQDYLASDATKKREAGIDPYPQATSAAPAQAPTAAPTAAPVSTGRPQSEAAPVSGGGIGGVPGAPPRTLDEIKQSNSLAGIESLTGPAQPAAAKPAIADSADGLKALAPVSSFAATQGIMDASTKPYMDEMNKLAKGISLNEGEKESQKYTRAGTALLTFSEQLLASGRPGASSVGAAFGKMGALAQEYAKEDTVERRAAIGSKMSLLGAQVQVAQGNTKNAIELFHHAEQMAFKDIEFRTNTKIKNEELRLKELGMFDEKEFRKQTIKYHNAQIEEQREWHIAHLPLLRAQANEATARGGYFSAAGAQNKSIIALAGQMRTADTKLAAQPGAAGTAAKARLADENGYAERARKQLGFETLGLGALEPKSSIQKDTIDPADVFKVN